jgi:pyruvate,water dikinase
VELARPRWREQPAYPLSVIASYLGCGPEASPAAVHRRRRQEREAIEARILARLRWRPLRRAAFRIALEVSQKASSAGENTKSAIMRIFWVMRCAALELGRRRVEASHLESANDIFFLLRAELLDAERDWRTVVAQRRSDHARWQREDAPRVIDGRGRPIREGLRRLRPPDADPSLLVGLGSSPGRARGRVRHVPDPACGVSLQPGEVLVAPYTDPAWTPLFVPAAAVVVEIGSLLSHASIVAREMGIPSVVALRGASSQLRDGELVEVDGTRGTVRRLEPGV